MYKYISSSKITYQGFTMIELMIAMAMGLLVVLVVTQIYQVSASTQRAENDMARLQESGRVAFDLITDEIQKAGYHNSDLTPKEEAIGPKTLAFCAKGGTGAEIEGTNDNGINRSDSLTLHFYGEQDATGTPTMRDCAGNLVGRGALGRTPVPVTETLYVQNDPNNGGEPTLFCSSSAAPVPVPLASGIESLQFLYGEDITAGGGLTHRYVPSTAVADTNKIFSVSVSFVLRTSKPISVDNSGSKIFNHFGTAYAPGDVAPSRDAGSIFKAPNDKRIRLRFGTTVAIRNLPCNGS